MALYIAEAAIATFLIVIFLILAFVPQEQKTEINIKEICLKALKALDESNELRKYALENDTESIKNKLVKLLPYQLNYEVFICSETCKIASFEEEKSRINYLLAGDIGRFQPLEIVLVVRK
ncbi:MAG: hypothetical protein QXQ69_02645 [Candidatus Aenigmatarchaeota archaeon]